MRATVRVGDAVFGTTNDWATVEDLGHVERVFHRCWGRRRGCVQSVQVSHTLTLRRNRSLKLILVWNETHGGWFNVLHRAARFRIVSGTSGCTAT